MNHLGQVLTMLAVKLRCNDDEMYGRVLNGHGCEPDAEKDIGTAINLRLDTGHVIKTDVGIVERIAQELELERAIHENWGRRCPVCTGQGETYTQEPNEFGGVNHIIAICEACDNTGLRQPEGVTNG